MLGERRNKKKRVELQYISVFINLAVIQVNAFFSSFS